MTHEESLKVTLEVLARHFDPPREIAATHEIQADLGLDSLAVMEIIADIEDAAGVHVPMEALESIVTVGDVAAALVRLTEGAPPKSAGGLRAANHGKLV